MEDPKFDALSRALATSGSRRAAFGALAGLLGGRTFGAQDAAARENKDRRRLKRRRDKARRRADRRQVRRQDRQDALSEPSPVDRCVDAFRVAGCTYGPVGLVNAWTCPPKAKIWGNLVDCDLHGSIFRDAQWHASCINCNLNNTDFSGAWFIQARFWGTTMIHTLFQNARMDGIVLDGVDARECDFGYANMRTAVFRRSEFHDAIFQMTDLTGVTWCPSSTCPESGLGDDCCGRLNGWHTPWCALNRDSTPCNT